MDELELVQRIEQFYNSAWEKLIYTAGALFAVIGLGVPIIFQWLQNRTLNLREKEIKEDVLSELAEQKKELQEEIKEEYKDEIEKLQQDIERKAKAMKGISFHLQANSQMDKKTYALATGSYFIAFDAYLIGKDYDNLRAVKNLLIKQCFPEISKTDIDDIFHKDDMTKEEYWAALKEADTENIVNRDIKDLIYETNKLPKTRK